MQLKMFHKMKYCKEQLRLTISQTARQLELSYPTVKKYWDETEESFEQMKKKKRQRKSKCDKYRDFTIERLKDYPDYSAAQIYSFIKEENNDQIDIGESTFRRYVAKLRKELDLEKRSSKKRDYQAVPERAPGEQAQLDYGECLMRVKESEKKVKVHFMAVVLSYSRFKYVEFSETKFDSYKTIEALERCFRFFGGIPSEIVIDQDVSLVSREYHGEIVFTETFNHYINELPLSVRVCHPRDPESKGKIENVVGYIKKNFLNGRRFKNIDLLNKQAMNWLKKVGNAKIHATTKKVPAERMIKERRFLKQIPNTNTLVDIIPQKIRKDNTVVFKGSRYEVEKGSFNKYKEAAIYAYNDHIEIYSRKEGVLLGSHILTESGPGRLYTLDQRSENRHEHAERLLVRAYESLKGFEDGTAFLDSVIKKHPHFIDSQIELLLKVLKEYEKLPTLIHRSLSEAVSRGVSDVSHFKKILQEKCLEHLGQSSPVPPVRDLAFWQDVEEIESIRNDPDYKVGDITEHFNRKYLEKITDIEGNSVL